MRRLFAGFVLAGLIVAAATAGTASAAAPPAVTRIEAPAADHVVRNGRVLVVVRSSAGLGALRLSVDGRDVTRYFRRSKGTYRAQLRVGKGLRYGVDELVVRTGKRRDFDRVRFVVPRRARNLLTVSDVRHDGAEAPVKVVVRAAPGSTLKAWVNDHRIDRAFQPEGDVHIGRLGANDWLRPGRNELSVLAHRTDRAGRSLYDIEDITFTRTRGQLTAGAGRDRLAEEGDAVILHASIDDADAATPDPAVSHRWEIVDQPPGVEATLEDPTSATPTFRATAPGDYLVRMTATAVDGKTSVDTVTVSARADAPPIGLRLDTVVDERGKISLDGKEIPGTAWQCPNPADPVCPSVAYASYAIFNRETLELVESGSSLADPPGLKILADRATFYNKAPSYLMVVNLSGYYGASPDGTRLLKMLGVATASTSDPINGLRPISVIGVPGSPAGSAFMSDPFYRCNCYPQPLQQTSMSGYLRLNPLSATGDFEFVYDDQLEFDTDASADPAQITMKVGDRTYARGVPTDGSAGFYLVRLNSQTLALNQASFYVTNNPDGSPNAADTQRLADDLALASATNSDRGALLVMLQAFGTPKGGLSGVRNTAGWQRAGAAIERLGGTAQVFIQQNRGFGVSPGKGRYAFVGRTAMSGAASESSQSLTDRKVDGKLHGLIARGRDTRYQPLIADGGGTVNFDLVKIVNRPTAPGGGFAAFTPGEAAAAKFLGRDPDVIGVCERPTAERPDPPCDVRTAYHERMDADWTTILAQLGMDETKAKCQAGGTGFNATDCEKVRTTFQTEFARRNRVANYFAGLQRPFLRGAQTAALVDVARIADDIRLAVKPPGANNAVSHVLNIMSFVTAKVAALSSSVAVGGAMAGAFGLAGYLTQHNGSPDVIGPQVSTAATKLGGELFDRYGRVSAYFSTEARIVMSDGTKLAQVADAVSAGGKWQLGFEENTVEQIRIGTRQAIYQALIPVAYPVLYDLGSGIGRAKDWYCWGGGLLISKHLFQRTTSPGGELVYFLTDPQNLGDNHLFAVGAVHTVDTLYTAYIPSPPDTLTDPLFRDPAHPSGGIGLYRLSFYSPQNFRVFKVVLQQHFDGATNRGYWYCDSMPNPPDNAG